MDDIEQIAQSRWPATFRALHQSNFRLFWLGTMIAIAGSWLQITALNWLVYRLTNSALMLGLISFVALLPVGLISPIAGVISDYFPPRKLLLVMRLIRALQALILAVLALTNSLHIWHIAVLLFIGATTDTLELPTRYVILTGFAGEENLSNAIALNAGAITIGSIVGPAVAGVLIGWLNEAICFFVSGSFNLVFVVCLLTMQIQAWTQPEQRLRLAKSLIDGLKYVWLDQSVKALLILLAAFSFLAQPYAVLMPVFARDVLHGGAKGYGLLMSASGASSLVGALVVASLKNGHRGKWLIGGALVFAFSLIFFSLSRWLPLSWVILLLVGSSQATLNVLGRSLSQTIAPKEFRGRVASFFALFNNGLARLGGLQAGALSQYISAPFAIQVGAALCLVWVLFITWRMPSVRHLP
jgi:MFS family permease